MERSAVFREFRVFRGYAFVIEQVLRSLRSHQDDGCSADARIRMTAFG